MDKSSIVKSTLRSWLNGYYECQLETLQVKTSYLHRTSYRPDSEDRQDKGITDNKVLEALPPPVLSFALTFSHRIQVSIHSSEYT